MTKIVHTKSEDRHSLEVFGHAGYGERGKDAVCASISSIVNLLTIDIMEDADAFVVLKEGDCVLRWTGHEEVWKAVHAAICYLEQEYPKNISYLTVK